jgi:hypothetical protein
LVTVYSLLEILNQTVTLDVGCLLDELDIKSGTSKFFKKIQVLFVHKHYIPYKGIEFDAPCFQNKRDCETVIQTLDSH